MRSQNLGFGLSGSASVDPTDIKTNEFDHSGATISKMENSSNSMKSGGSNDDDRDDEIDDKYLMMNAMTKNYNDKGKELINVSGVS